jgi:hypothetical protein
LGKLLPALPGYEKNLIDFGGARKSLRHLQGREEITIR